MSEESDRIGEELERAEEEALEAEDALFRAAQKMVDVAKAAEARGDSAAADEAWDRMRQVSEKIMLNAKYEDREARALVAEMLAQIAEHRGQPWGDR